MQLDTIAYPDRLTADTVTVALDVGVGQLCLAVQSIGEITDDLTFNSQMEESDTGNSNWTPIDGAVFPTVYASYRTADVLFRTTKRYIRWSCLLEGGDPTNRWAATNVTVVR